jgi:hypothetical protein
MTTWRKGSQPFLLRQQLIAVAVLACVLFAPSLSFSESRTNEDLVSLEFSALGKRGEAIVRAREQVLEHRELRSRPYHRGRRSPRNRVGRKCIFFLRMIVGGVGEKQARPREQSSRRKCKKQGTLHD